MKELWNEGKQEQRVKLLNEIYGNSLNYMSNFRWSQLPYGIQERMNKFYNMFKNN